MRKALCLITLLLLMCSGAVFADSHGANAGVAAVPDGAEGPGIVLPGGAYEFVIHAHDGDSLSFATMLAQSNDGFLAPNEYGIALYDMGAPVSGDVTDQVYYWDLGSERNEPIGQGMYQAPRQSAPNTGPAGDGIVRLASDLDDNYSYPTAAELVVVTLTAGDMGEFTVRIENVSDMSMYPSPITPVFWIVHASDMMMMDDDMMMDKEMSDDDMMDEEMSDDDMMDEEMSDDDMMDEEMSDDDMDEEMSDDDMGEEMSDDDMGEEMSDDDMMDEEMSDDDMMDDDMDKDMSDDMMMDDDMMMKHGILFTSGQPDYGHGLEALAEDGDPSALAAHHGVMIDDMMMGDMMMMMDDEMMDDDM